MNWQRGFRAESYRQDIHNFRTKQREGTAPLKMEHVIVDAMVLCPDMFGEEIEGAIDASHHEAPVSSRSLDSFQNSEVLVPRSEDEDRHGNQVLGMLDGWPLLQTCGSTGLEIAHFRSGGEKKLLWQQEREERLQQYFEAGLVFLQGFFARGSFYVLARPQDPSDDRIFLFQASLERDGGGVLAALHFDRCEEQTHERRGSLTVLGSDREETAGRIHTSGDVMALSLATLRATAILDLKRLKLELQLHSRLRLALDPVTLDLYVLLDRSLKHHRGEESHSCKIYRVRSNGFDGSSPTASIDGALYDDAAAELICFGDFCVDGFSDSFCMTCHTYDAQRDCIAVFDAGDGLWVLPMADARNQAAIEGTEESESKSVSK
jgi:hypothetical protein